MVGYTAAKTGLLDLAPRGIRVNLFSPGAVDTPRYRQRITDDAAMARLREHFPPAPLDRIATPKDVAASPRTTPATSPATAWWSTAAPRCGCGPRMTDGDG
jgi:NAD(P)-dependent dehydrogenase (short-subunit alcohol dehydrogenase family)